MGLPRKINWLSADKSDRGLEKSLRSFTFALPENGIINHPSK
jgi:hypothetical protein